MGSFNIACSASNISINAGDEVAFFLLRARRDYYDEKKASPIPTTTMFIGTDNLYEPIALPVFGVYNDYGSIDNIVSDANTAILEEEFGIPVQDIVSFLTDGREPLEMFSESFNIFKIKDFGYEYNINDKHLLEYGFVEKNIGEYFHKDANITLFTSDDKRGDYKKITINEKEYKFSRFSELQSLMFSEFNYIISIEKERQYIIEKMKYLKSLSGMFVHRDIYNTFVSKTFDGKKSSFDNLNEYPCPAFLRALGFTFKEEGKQNTYADRSCSIFEKDGTILKLSDFGLEVNNIKSTLFRMNDVFKYLDENTNLNLNPEDIKGIDYLKENILDDLVELSEASHENKTIEKMMRGNIFRELRGKISISNYNNPFAELYLKYLSIENKAIVDNISDFKSFYWTFYSTNHMFMPSMNGEQDGNPKLSSLLYKKANQIVNKSRNYFSEDIPSYYLETEDIEKCKIQLLEIIEDYIDPSSIAGLSKFEINLFKKDNSILQEILDCYI